jgi:hypothetical protein
VYVPSLADDLWKTGAKPDDDDGSKYRAIQKSVTEEKDRVDKEIQCCVYCGDGSAVCCCAQTIPVEKDNKQKQSADYEGGGFIGLALITGVDVELLPEGALEVLLVQPMPNRKLAPIRYLLVGTTHGRHDVVEGGNLVGMGILVRKKQEDFEREEIFVGGERSAQVTASPFIVDGSD